MRFANRMSFLMITAVLVALGLSVAAAAKGAKNKSSFKSASKKGQQYQKARVVIQDDVLRARRHDDMVREFTTYRGTSITFRKEGPVADLALSQKISGQFALQDPVPDVRKAYFRWLDGRMDLNIVGWQGHIQEISPSPKGFRVRISVIPALRSPTGGAISPANPFFEVYEYANGRLNFLDGQGPADVGIVVVH